MKTIKIIPCLDIKGGRVVKGIKFVNLRDAGDPVESARSYEEQGADELAFLDISATNEQRDTVVDLAKRVVNAMAIPLTVGGGIRSIEDARRLLDVGVSKVSINTAAVRNPDLINKLAAEFGSPRIVAAIDATRAPGGKGWEVVTHGGERGSGRDVVTWAREVCQRGVGEILLTSLDADGTRAGYDLPMTAAVADAVPVPVTASGGAGTLEHLVEGVTIGHASAVLAASVFHFGEINIRQAKEYMARCGIPVHL